MEHHQLGRTGVSVSKFCLGAMMFGAWGNPDHDESIRIIHRRSTPGINFIDTADVYGAGESEEIVGKALAGGRRDDVVLATKFHNAMGEDPNRQRQLAALDHARGRGLAAAAGTPTGSTSTRSTARTRAPTSRRRCRRSPTSSTRARSATSAPRPSPPARSSRRSGSARDRRLQRFVTEQPPYSILVRAVEADVLPTCARHGMAVMSYSPLAGGWLSGRWRKDAGQQSSSRAGRLPERFDLANPSTSASSTPSRSSPSSPRRPGITLIQLAIAFVLNHPAITAALIGPRTMEQLESQLAAADVVLDEARAGPHRRDRPARHDDQPGRQLLREPGAGAGRAAAVRGRVGLRAALVARRP